MRRKKEASPRRFGSGVFAALLLLGLAAADSAAADLSGRIIKTNETVIEFDAIRWRRRDQAYEVTRGEISINVPRSDVARVEVKEPAGLRAAAASVQKGQPRPAMQPLAQIVKKYEMFEHDIPAARWLAQAQIDTGEARAAVALLEPIIDGYGMSFLPGDFINVYLDALLKSDQIGRLEGILTEIIRDGSRGSAAFAQIKRGDLLMKKDRPRDALLDGYLRTAVLFEDVKEAVPEALFKAVKCFEQLGQVAHADKMQKKLMTEYPLNSYTRQLQSGK